MRSTFLFGLVLFACAHNQPPVEPEDDASTPSDYDSGGLPPQGDACARTCADFHTVIDCNGKTVETCGAEQGCAGGLCVSACDATEAEQTSVGCDYWAVAPDTYYYTGCYAIFVANTWGSPIGLSLDRGGVALDISGAARLPKGSGTSLTYEPLPGGKIPPNQVAIVFAARIQSGCPLGVTPAVLTDPTTHGTGIGSAFHLKTTAPAVAYQIYPYGGGTSAVTSSTLLLPTSAWGTNYIAVDPYKPLGDTWISFIASQDGTTVTISPTVAIVGGNGIAGTGAGVPHTYKIDKGQYLELAQPTELIGSIVQSNKPIGMFGGDTCMDVPITAGSCDSGHQQIPPVRALGHEYVGVQYRDRYDGIVEAPPWRIVGAADGTILTWEDAPPSAPTSLSIGEMVEFSGHGPFVVRSQDENHPFYMAQYMTGCSKYAPSFTTDCRGDPEFVNMLPAEQYLDKYLFFTDPTYPETNLVVVRSKQTSGFADVELDCKGVLGDWRPIGTSGKYEYAHVDLVRGNWEKQGSCDNGAHRMTSKGRFGLTVWGWGSGVTGPYGSSTYSQFVSYGYVGGAGVAPINTVIVPPAPK